MSRQKAARRVEKARALFSHRIRAFSVPEFRRFGGIMEYILQNRYIVSLWFQYSNKMMIKEKRLDIHDRL